MATISAVSVEQGDSLLILWPSLEAADTGAPVDVSRYSRISVIADGFTNTDDVSLQGATRELAGTLSDYVILESEVGLPGAGATMTFTEAGSAKVSKLHNVVRIRPLAGAATGTGATSVTVAAMASR